MTWRSAVLILFACAAPARAADDRPSLCVTDEVAVFSCAIGEKIASLCASPDLAEDAGTLVYRFGRPGAPELVHPDAPMRAGDAFVGGVLRSGDFVRFTRGGHTYSLTSEFVRDGGQVTGEVEGVEVRKGARIVFRGRCRDFALGDDGWSRVYRAKLPQAPFEE